MNLEIEQSYTVHVDFTPREWEVVVESLRYGSVQPGIASEAFKLWKQTATS